MKPIKIIVTGTRGIPNIQGGVETHCEELYPLLVKNGCDVTIIRRTSYVSKENKTIKEFKSVKLKDIYAPKLKSFEAFVHTFLSVWYARFKSPDILHIHAIGPSLMVPLARLLFMKVVVTHHGPDYERQKWGCLAKRILKLGERLGVKFANRIIVISQEIGISIEKKYNKKNYSLIPNGVPSPVIDTNDDFLQQLGVKSRQYLFTLGRFVPEKGFDYFIEAYKNSDLCEKFPLIIAGDSDHETEYSRNFKDLSKKEGVILTGFIKGKKLHQLYSHARLFILPSFYEGLPIALLEAMSYELPILASDIQANKQVHLAADHYFKVGDISDLSNEIQKELEMPFVSLTYDLSVYEWKRIADETFSLYKDILNK